MKILAFQLNNLLLILFGLKLKVSGCIISLLVDLNHKCFILKRCICLKGFEQLTLTVLLGGESESDVSVVIGLHSTGKLYMHTTSASTVGHS